MTLPDRRHRVAMTVMVAFAVLGTACSPATGASSSLAAGSSVASASPVATPAVTPTATVRPTATAKPTANPTATPTAKPTSKPTAKPTPCPVAAEIERPPSDRLVDVRSSTTESADRLTFVFRNDAVEGPGGPPVGELSVAEPPYTFGPSGLPITMVGDRVLQVVFRQMSLVADTGEPVYGGPADLSPDDPALKHAVQYDESEGVVGWYVGYDGPGCVTITENDSTITLTFAHAG